MISYELLKNKLNVVFYRSLTGNEPVRDWLKGLTKEDKKTLGEDIKTIQFGWPLGMPLVRNLGNGLWEIRARLKRWRIAKIIFCMHQNSMVLLHGFMKKSQKTLNHDLALARQRKNDVIRGTK